MKINKDVFAKTKNKLLKINMLVVMCFLCMLLAFTMVYFRYITYSNIDKEIGQEFKHIVTQLDNSEYEPIKLLDPKDMVYIYENGRIKYYTENDYFEKILPERKSDTDQVFTKYRENGHFFKELNITVGDYHIQIIRNIDSEMFSISKLISIILFLGIISLIFIYMISLYLTKKALVPIETAWKNQAKFIQDASHELRTPITIVSSKLESLYMISLYLTKKALVPIETAWKNQAKFIQDASHELRTPITIVSSKLESLLKKPESTIGDEAETVAIAMKETRRLKKMVNDLLSLTKEDGIVQLNKENLDLKTLIDEITEDYFDIAEYQDKEFSCDILTENTEVYTDKNKFKQILRIFIDNAFKYTKSGDSIGVVVREDEDDKDKLIISVNDSGIGISKEDLPNLFDRFFRSDNEK